MPFQLAEALWQVAAPIAPGDELEAAARDGMHLSPADGDVLQLLQAGMADHAIARRLGASERTIGRRVRKLMDAAGAQTRFQLGWRAAERGWLAATDAAMSASSADAD